MKVWVRRAVAGLAAAVALAGGVAAASTPASAAETQCAGKPSKQIGSTARFGTKYTRFGWAEWRWGTSGSCYHRKWIQIHVTESGLYMSDPSDGHFGGLGCAWGIDVWDRHSTDWGGRKCWYSGMGSSYHVRVGTWSSYGYYGYHKSLAGMALGWTTHRNRVYLGSGTYND